MSGGLAERNGERLRHRGLVNQSARFALEDLAQATFDRRRGFDALRPDPRHHLRPMQAQTGAGRRVDSKLPAPNGAP